MFVLYKCAFFLEKCNIEETISIFQSRYYMTDESEDYFDLQIYLLEPLQLYKYETDIL